MKFYCFFIFASLYLFLSNVHAQSSDRERARDVLSKTLLALGKGWDTVNSIKVRGYGTRFAVDQSERYEGPYISDQYTRTLTFDFPGKEVLAECQTTAGYFGPSPVATYVVNDGDIALKQQNKLLICPPDDELQDQFLYQPIFLVKTALSSSSLKIQRDTILQKKPAWVLQFQYNNFPVRLFINQETNLPTAAEIIKPHPGNYGSLWGDAKKMICYSFWVLPSGNVHYPAQEDIYLNDYYIETFLATKIEVNNPLIQGSLVKIPDDIKDGSRNFLKRSMDNYVKSFDTKVKEIAKDIWIIPGPCNTTVVKQSDGLVVIESSLSSEYGEAIIQKTKEIFPGINIKAFIATSDAWLHLGGIRAFAALDIPIYFPYLNKPLLQKVLHAPFITHPDILASKKYHSYSLHEIRNVVTIGTGANRVCLYPYKTETGDRMMMVYFPAYQLLYCSDLYQPKGSDGKYWQPHYAWEVYHSIEEYKLPVKKFYAMHQAGLLDFSELEKDFKG